MGHRMRSRLAASFNCIASNAFYLCANVSATRPPATLRRNFLPDRRHDFWRLRAVARVKRRLTVHVAHGVALFEAVQRSKKHAGIAANRTWVARQVGDASSKIPAQPRGTARPLPGKERLERAETAGLRQGLGHSGGRVACRRRRPCIGRLPYRSDPGALAPIAQAGPEAGHTQLQVATLRDAVARCRPRWSGC